MSIRGGKTVGQEATPMQWERLKIGVDVDDVLYLCNQHAIDLLFRDREDMPPSIYDITGWGPTGNILDERIAFFSRPDFVENQPIIPGAQAFIRELVKRGEVFFSTAVGASCMSARAERLIRDFPEVPERNIMIGARKDLLSLDILLDDGAHNILGSSATYPVLFRRPWNNHLTGLLAVNAYDDFLRLVDQIRKTSPTGTCDLSRGGVVCLIGPSGSGKTALVHALMRDARFDRPITSTTRKRRGNEQEEYHYISRGAFQQGQEDGRFLESTVYGGEYYGATRDAVDAVVSAGRIAVMPVDICGGISLKNAYPNKCLLVFLKCDRSRALYSILQRDCPEQEKVLRILSLDAEYRNEDICDYTLRATASPEATADVLMNIIG